MTNATITTATGPRTMTAEAVAQFDAWQAGRLVSISTDHPMLRHSPNALPWAHPGTHVGCSTWGQWNDRLRVPPSPDHYFVGG
jgi:hypothetical protein